jgi:two-component sensor histidine kinase
VHYILFDDAVHLLELHNAAHPITERRMMLELVPTKVPEVPAFDEVAEANYRIANSLSIISGLLQMRGSALCSEPRPVSGHEIRLILEEVASRLEAVARLHRLLAKGRQEPSVNVADYLREIPDGVVSSLSIAEWTELQFASDPGCLVPAKTALPLGLIAAELVTNAVKYAHPAGVVGQLTFACRRSLGGDITIEISDDGVGLPEGIDPMKNGHSGFQVVRLLTDQLGAEIAFHSDALGLRVTLQIPAAAQC